MNGSRATSCVNQQARLREVSESRHRFVRSIEVAFKVKEIFFVRSFFVPVALPRDESGNILKRPQRDRRRHGELLPQDRTGRIEVDRVQAFLDCAFEIDEFLTAQN